MDCRPPLPPLTPLDALDWFPRVLHTTDTAIVHANRPFLNLLGYSLSASPLPPSLPPFRLPYLPQGPDPLYHRSALPHQSGPYIPVLIATMRRSEGHLFESIVLPIHSDTLNGPNLVPLLLAQQDHTTQDLARELHDTTAQTLAALAINLSILTNLVGSSTEAQRVLTECTQLTNEALLQVRRTSYRLHPPLLTELGLAPALRNYVEIYQASTGIDTRLTVATDWHRLPDHDEQVVFRIIQERLAYLETYGDATECVLELALTPTAATVTITDNSDSEIAFLPLDHPLRYSFAVLQARANSIPAELRIENASRSTTIHAIIARS